MKEVSFFFRGKWYRGFIAISREEYPHFYWCFLDDPGLVKSVGDCISFKMEEGGPLQLSELYPPACHDLLEVLKGIVETYQDEYAGSSVPG